MPLKIFLAAFLAPLCLQSLEFKPVVDLDLRGGYAVVEGGTKSGLVLGSAYVVPALSFEGGPLLLPNIYANASGQERSIEEDTVFVRTLLYGIRPVLKFKYSESSSFQIRADAKRSMNVEAVNESFGTGVYDYDEYGGGLGADFAKALPVPFGLGLDFSRRGYPNYRKVGAELTENKNYYVKDYWNLKPSLKADFGLGGRFSLSLQFKNYTDSYIYQEKGLALDLNQLQSDLLVTADLRGALPLTKSWQFVWALTDMSNSSNQSSIEASSNSTFWHSQDYNAFTASPGLRWGNEDWAGAVAYSAVFRNLNRPIKNSDNSYAQGKISDLEQGINADLKRKIGAGLSGVVGASYRNVQSNQVSTQGGQPNYSFYNVNAGFLWNWQAK